MDPQAVQQVGDETVTEAVLNYGTEAEVQELFSLYGQEFVAKIFRKQAFSPRTNYLNLTKNFFTLYFNRHAPHHTH